MTDAEPIRSPPSSRAPCALLALLVLGPVGACTPSEPPPAKTASEPTPRPLAPAIRLVDSEFVTGGGPSVERGAHVEIDGVIRPVLSGAREFLLKPTCEPVTGSEELVDCSIPQPEKLTARFAVVEAHPEPVPGETHEATPPIEPVRKLIRGPGHPDAATEVVRVPKPASGFVTRRFIEDLSQRGVLSPGYLLPGRSRVRTWIGIEKQALGPQSPEVVFEASVFQRGDEQLTRVFRTTLDPANRPEHRTWIPVEFEIPESGFEPLQIVFETRNADEEDDRPSLPVWGDPTILRPLEGHEGPSRVVLISLDTLRAGSMSVYGNDRRTTPLFEKMAGEGTLFENAFTTFSNTLGSHMSLMTGLYPATHRVNAASRHLDRAIPTLAMGMREAGYETAAFTENALLRADAGFQRGFGHYFENSGTQDGAGDAEGTFRRALDYLETKPPSEPLFLFVHTYEVHSPYEPPEYTAREIEPLVWDEAPEKRALDMRSRYEREIVHLDRLLADFLDELATLAPAEDVLVVITSDHGEEFLEHGSILHLQLYDEVMKIPLFLRWPGNVPAGLRIETPVSLVDVVPTVLQLVGATPPTTDGVSLVPLLEGAEIARDAVFGQSAVSSFNQYRPQFVVRSAAAKCVGRQTGDGGRVVQCFDLTRDPLEKHALAPSENAQFGVLEEQLGGYFDRAIRTVDGEAEEREIEAADEIDPARREKLRMLGYIE